MIVVGAILGWYDEDVSADELEVGRVRRARRRRHRGDDAAARRRATRTTRARSSRRARLEGGDDFPGDEADRRRARSSAPATPSSDYVGAPYLRSELEIYTVYPLGVRVGRGDREIVCLAIRPDGSDMDTSVRDSGN